ncbi:recombinase family protein [Dongia sp.]|uniref:recombinase family protein n=1 Tax=Dongia sp. TaxID=1977262 RepID=UPI0035B33301
MRYFVYCRKSSEAEDRQILSIDSQKEELRRAFEKVPGIEIVGAFEEAFSAKAPGRKIFDEMLRRIEQGEAEGIITWHPDRLARNSVDGGRIIYLLDRKILKELKFATFTFENNSQGKFMLSIIFGYSKYYVDSLSENVKRGNRAKIARGWRPNHAPIGYKNDPASKTIVRDEDRFNMVRHVFDLALSNTRSLRGMALESQRWGLKTMRRHRIGGRYLGVSAIHNMLTNPFYAGILSWAGEMYPGAHEPMVTCEEFDRVQRNLGRVGKPSPKKHFFPYTGLIRCGECGLMITAERKINRYGYQYVYYHCTRKRLDLRCTQLSITAPTLESAFTQFLGCISIPLELHEWALNEIESRMASGELGIKALIHSGQKALDATKRALSNLTSLRVNEMIDEDEFSTERKRLVNERRQLEQRLESIKESGEWLEPARALLCFSSRALEWYRDGLDDTRRQIIQSVGSNLVLRNRKLSIEARKPFVIATSSGVRSELLAALNEFRNLFQAQDAETLDTVECVKSIISKCDKQSEVKKVA